MLGRGHKELLSPVFQLLHADSLSGLQETLDYAKQCGSKQG